MGFALRINFVDVVCDNSLKNTYINGKKNGFEFDIRLSYYRGHFLSVIDKFEVAVDGIKVDEHDVVFCINDKEFAVNQLQYAYDEFWDILEPARIKVRKPGGLEVGEHEIDVTVMFRSPYMPLPSADNDHLYMPIDGCGKKVLSIEG
ncbi:DUF6379 domain-containing protein [Clostridium intestinale]|uniref:C-glycoside deglycosidase beta subunit domain-containing protein n=1 Tax=Clostridium intestinale TaxID=36845 RepID=UPI0028E37486|nr:DUF6379 domain-containing protein [Clostridium intestinale]